MNVIPPIAATLTAWAAILTSSTAAEPGPGEVAWVSGTTYALNDVRIYAATHRQYQRLVAGAGTVTPDLDTANWLDIGPTNKWAMLDTQRNSGTSVASPLTVVVTPGMRVNALAVMGVVADALTISMTSVGGGGTVYTKSVNLVNRHISDWYGYFFAPFNNLQNYLALDLPPYTDGIITITLTRATGNVSCGALVIGTSVYLGGTQYNAVSDALNSSTVTRDAFGNSILIPRRSVPKTDQVLFVDKSRVNILRDARTALNAVPAVWSGLDDPTDGYFEALLILGIYKQFSINLAQPSMAQVNLQLEEV